MRSPVSPGGIPEEEGEENYALYGGVFGGAE